MKARSMLRMGALAWVVGVAATSGHARAAPSHPATVPASVPASAPASLPASGDAPLTVVFGASAGTSGSRGAVGQDFNNGVILAVEDLNRRHVRVGASPVLWKVVTEDDQADPRQAATVAQKFIDTRVAGVIGPDTSGGAYAAVRLLNAASIPMMVPAATDTRLAHMGSKTFFRVITDDAVVSTALANYAQHDLHLRSVALLDDRTAFGQGLADAFARAATARGIRVIAREYTNDKAMDFSAVLTRLRGMRPDAIMFGGVYAQAAQVLRQMDMLGFDVPLLVGDGVCVEGLPELAGAALRHVVCGDGGRPLQRMRAGIEWKRRYDQRFGARAFQVYSPYSYDATMVLAQAMQRAGSTDPARYLPALRTVDYDGVTREHIRFDSHGELSDPQVTISVYREGSKVPLRVETVPR